jgi:hypothetical protein
VKLYIVRITREAFVLADTEMGALEHQREIERWEDYPTIECYEAGTETLPGWDDGCFVYHGDGEKNITLAEAKELCK